jgi:membrane-bound lytic murein transglycosylase B
MQITRRAALLMAGASTLSACIPVAVTRDTAPAGLGPEFRPQPNADYDAWVAAFRTRARAAGITDATLARGFEGQGFLPGVVERDRNQTEFRRTTEDYLALVASEEDIATGQPRVRAVRSVLADIERATGVDADVLAAIWGVETRYGTRLGEIPVVSATSTLAWEGRRGRFFEAQLLAALQDHPVGRHHAGPHGGLLGRGDGAHAADADGVPGIRRSISGATGGAISGRTIPTDGFASTANYLVRYNWQRGEPWGIRGASARRLRHLGQAGDGTRGPFRSGECGRAAGSGGALPDHGEAAIHAPAGPTGPAWVLYRNFNTILRYNPSTNYAIGIGYMANRLAGGGPLRAQLRAR